MIVPHVKLPGDENEVFDSSGWTHHDFLFWVKHDDDKNHEGDTRTLNNLQR